jgi:D-xylose transport system substrate-binding protein
MKGAGISPLPPVTGQDAELAAVQRILVGEQYMTVYKAIRLEAEAAAELAVDLVSKQPVAVTKDNINATVVKDGFWTVQQICTAQYQSACQQAGLMQQPAAAPSATP